MTDDSPVIWREHDNRGLVCELPGNLSSEAFQRVRQVFTQQVHPYFDGGVEFHVDTRLVIVTRVAPSLTRRDSIHRKWLTNLIECALNGDGR